MSAHPLVKGNEEMELVVMAMELGKLDADEVSKETGVAKNRIYEIRRKLREKIYPDIANMMLSSGCKK